MDYASSLLGLLPGGRRTPGLKELLAAQRARRLANGAEPTVAWENDKPTVVALREIAAGNITAEMLREPEPPAQNPLPEMEHQSTFRAPQFGLGD